MIKSCVCFPENVGCIPLAVVIMTTANGMHPTFSERYTQLDISSDLYQYLPTSHGDCGSELNPCYVNTKSCVFAYIMIKNMTHLL